MDVSALPALNATLNSISAVLLTAGFVLIRKGKRRAHLACMVSAFVVSVLFLISYVTYHAHAGSVPFTGQGLVRPLYFLILITHIILAAAIVPMALITLSRAATGRFPAHARLARWTLPVWLYVSITGVVVYVMLYHLYPTT
jgi:uncharacterized membrane protein YozB (DUF420 family)